MGDDKHPRKSYRPGKCCANWSCETDHLVANWELNQLRKTVQPWPTWPEWVLRPCITTYLTHYGNYCILRGRIKGFNSSITAIMCQVGSHRTVVGSHRMVE